MTKKVVINSTGTMRSFLLDQMVNVANGEQEACDAKAICNYAQQVYNTINMELRFAIATKREHLPLTAQWMK